MPVYEYRCKSCSDQFEVQQSFSDDPLTTCEKCEGELRKVFSPVGISFKGSGFYKNDNRSSSSKGSSGSSDSSKSDSKTADSSSSSSSDTPSSSSSSEKSTSSSTSSTPAAT